MKFERTYTVVCGRFRETFYAERDALDFAKELAAGTEETRHKVYVWRIERNGQTCIWESDF
jgi:hypothetical protein